jgi:hypothetical protein
MACRSMLSTARSTVLIRRGTLSSRPLHQPGRTASAQRETARTGSSSETNDVTRSGMNPARLIRAIRSCLR